MTNKRQRFETSDVIKMLDSSAEDPMMCGSNDEFDDFDEDTDPSDDERIPLPSPLDYTSSILPSSSSLLLSDTDIIPLSPPPLLPPILATSTNIASTCIQTSSITSADNQHLPQCISPPTIITFIVTRSNIYNIYG